MGTFFSFLGQFYPPKSKWWQNDIPDLTGKVAIVTGGKTGIGRETVKALLQHNAKVYIAARGKNETQKTIAELKQQTGKEAVYLELDIADFASIRAAAAEFLSKEAELHILFNNAGVMWPPHSVLTKDGYDVQWGVHVVGPHLFTKLMMPALVAGAQTSRDGKARVITTSSGYAYTGKIHWDSFRPGSARSKMGTDDLYSQSKLAQAVWSCELARRYDEKNILCLSLNPGNLRTDLQRHMNPTLLPILNRLFLHPLVPYGSLTQLYAGTSPDVLDKNGAFLIPWARVGPVPPECKKPEVGERLWNYLETEVDGR